MNKDHGEFWWFLLGTQTFSLIVPAHSCAVDQFTFHILLLSLKFTMFIHLSICTELKKAIVIGKEQLNRVLPYWTRSSLQLRLMQDSFLMQMTLRWFLHNIRAIMAKMKLPKKPHSMVTFLIKVRRSYRDLSSQADPARDNWTWSCTYLRTFRVSRKHNNTRMRHSHEVRH